MAIEIEFKNYKVFKDLQKFKLRNINIIIGKNNSGKSALLKFPKLISDISKFSLKPLILNSPDIEYAGAYQDFVYGKANRAIEYKLYRDDNPKSIFFANIVVENNNGEYNPVFEKWAFGDILLEYEGSDNKYIFNKKEPMKCEFKGLDISRTWDSIAVSLEKESPSNYYSYKTTHIPSIRENIKRYIDFSLTNNDSASYGGYFDFLKILIDDYTTVERKVFSKVSNWYKENFEGWELHIDLDKAPIYSIYFKQNNIKINIADTGVGIIQVLSILVKAAIEDDVFEIISIEEPECHLNTAVHGNLLEFLINSVQSNLNKHYIIETHSENFVLRLRRLIAEGKLDKKTCSIYHVDFDYLSTSSSLKEIKILEKGIVEYWPNDIFNDSFNEVIAIRSAQE